MDWQAVAEARGATAAAIAMSEQLHRRSMRETIGAWRTAAAESAFQRAAAEDRAVKQARRFRLEQVYVSWRTAAAGAAAAASAAAGKLQRDAAERQLVDAFQTWRSEAADGAQQVQASRSDSDNLSIRRSACTSLTICNYSECSGECKHALQRSVWCYTTPRAPAHFPGCPFDLEWSLNQNPVISIVK